MLPFSTEVLSEIAATSSWPEGVYKAGNLGTLAWEALGAQVPKGSEAIQQAKRTFGAGSGTQGNQLVGRSGLVAP